jgi:hypothetical protein
MSFFHHDSQNLKILILFPVGTLQFFRKFFAFTGTDVVPSKNLPCFMAFLAGSLRGIFSIWGMPRHAMNDRLIGSLYLATGNCFNFIFFISLFPHQHFTCNCCESLCKQVKKSSSVKRYMYRNYLDKHCSSFLYQRRKKGTRNLSWFISFVYFLELAWKL